MHDMQEAGLKDAASQLNMTSAVKEAARVMVFSVCFFQCQLMPSGSRSGINTRDDCSTQQMNEKKHVQTHPMNV